MIQSVHRALDIVEEVARSDEGARLTEIAASLDLNKTTAHNLIRSLVARGYLARNGGYRYQLGPALGEMARLRIEQGIFRRAERVMRDLYDEYTSAKITFSELTGNELCCRLRLAPELPGVLRRPQSQTFSPCNSASGLCLQAFNVNFHEAMSAMGGFSEDGQRLWSTAEEFERALAETVRRGVAVLPGDLGWRLAAPVGENHVLGLCLDMSAQDETAVCTRLREAAEAIAGK